MRSEAGGESRDQNFTLRAPAGGVVYLTQCELVCPEETIKKAERVTNKLPVTSKEALSRIKTRTRRAGD